MWRDMVEIILEIMGLADMIVKNRADLENYNATRLILYETMNESEANSVRGCRTANGQT